MRQGATMAAGNGFSAPQTEADAGRASTVRPAPSGAGRQQTNAGIAQSAERGHKALQSPVAEVAGAEPAPRSISAHASRTARGEECVDRPRAFGCGFIADRRRGYCAVATCRRTTPCQGAFADDIARPK